MKACNRLISRFGVDSVDSIAIRLPASSRGRRCKNPFTASVPAIRAFHGFGPCAIWLQNLAAAAGDFPRRGDGFEGSTQRRRLRRADQAEEEAGGRQL